TGEGAPRHEGCRGRSRNATASERGREPSARGLSWPPQKRDSVRAGEGAPLEVRRHRYHVAFTQERDAVRASVHFFAFTLLACGANTRPEADPLPQPLVERATDCVWADDLRHFRQGPSPIASEPP